MTGDQMQFVDEVTSIVQNIVQESGIVPSDASVKKIIENLIMDYESISNKYDSLFEVEDCKEFIAAVTYSIKASVPVAV
jgi:hypothetical protein